MVVISIIGVRTTMPNSIVVCAASAASPPAISATSKEVPPMSPVITSGKPALRATCAAAITPAAGPDSAVRIGKRVAVSTAITPPFDCTIRSWPVEPAAARRSSIDFRYEATTGWR